MQGLEYLKRLPQPKRDGMVAKYGSLEDLYKRIMSIENKLYSMVKVSDEAPEKQIVIKQRWVIEDDFEAVGMEDGVDAFSAVAADFGDIIVSRNVKALDSYLAQYGTDFPTMRQWLKDNLGL